jgi:hypothetical protein
LLSADERRKPDEVVIQNDVSARDWVVIRNEKN